MTNSAKVLPDPILTPEAYLLSENDNNTGTRHEYVNGLIYAMTGASRNHNRLVRRLMTRPDLHLQGTRCEPFQSDMKVKIKHGNDVRFYYSDVQVACEEEADRYYNAHPCLIAEVLSDSLSEQIAPKSFWLIKRLNVYKSMSYYLKTSLTWKSIADEPNGSAKVPQKNRVLPWNRLI